MNIVTLAMYFLVFLRGLVFLAPLLFLIYINDLPLHVSNKVCLYADDVVLYSIIHTVDDCHNLQ